MPAPARTAAVVTAAVCAVASVGALVAVAQAGRWSVDGFGEAPVDAVVGSTFAGMGALVLAGRRGSTVLGRLLLVQGVASALVVVSTCLAVLADTPSTGARAAVHLQSWLWVPGFVPLLTLLPLLYPDGRLPGPRWRPVVWTSVVGMVLLAGGVILHPQEFAGAVPIPQPWTAAAVAGVAFPVGALLVASSSVAALASLVVRWRRASGLARRQLVTFVVAAGAAVLSAVVYGVLPSPAGTVVQAVAVGLVPVAVGVAVTRHRLYDLDLALCRALVVASLAVSLGGVFLTVLFALRAVLPEGSAAVAAGVTGLLVQPLAGHLRRGVDRLFYGRRAEPYAVLAGLSAQLRAVEDAPAALCSTVVDALRLSSASVTLTGAAVPVAVAGVPSGPGWEVPLRHRGEAVGTFTVTPREGELAVGDRELLAALADQAAPALAALALTDDLRRSRQALVTAREEERRRLRSDLHDGLGAALAGVRLQLDAAADLVEDARARRVLDAATAGVVEAVADVRRLTDDLRPPALDELGLPGSLVALGERLRTPSLSVKVDVAPLQPLPAATEVAAYRIAAEALANAARHSGARNVLLQAAAAGGRVTLTVQDDGGGVSSASGTGGSGLGLPSMRQRAEEIGGELSLSSSSAGTTVRAVLPT